MPDMSAWLGMSVASGSRAEDAWNRIQDKATEITVIRSSSPLANQTVRIEFNSATRGAEMMGAGAGQTARANVIVFGVRDHPSIGVPDTDLQRGDRFAVDGKQYRVVLIIRNPGEIQAICEALE